MKKFAILFCLLSIFAFVYAADYPLDDYVELEDSKPVDESAWRALDTGLFFTWGSKDIHYSYKNVPKVEYRTDTLIHAWRGERISALALIYSKEENKDLQLSLSDFVQGNQSIHTESTANFVNYVMTDGLNANGNGSCGARPDHSKFDSSMVADVIDKLPIKTLKAKHVRPVWCSFEIPRNILPGNYVVTLNLKHNLTTLKTLNITIQILDKTLPQPSDYVFNVDFWQQPYSVSRYYKVEKWSKEHFDAMRPMMKALARAGQTSISTEIIYEPWGDQSHDKFDPMIETIKKTDGSWSYDYTIFDKWVQFMMDCGIKKEIKCFSMVPWDMSFRYWNESSKSYKFLHAQTYSQEYKDFWTPLLTNFVSHLKEKGWYNITTMCMDEREMWAMTDAYNLLQKVVPGMKMSLAGSYHRELVDKFHYYCLQYGEYFSNSELASRNAKGYISTLYTCCSSSVPNAYTFSSPAESACLPLHAIERGVDGFLRWAYNNWGEDPLRDSRYRFWGAGDPFMIYPGFRSSVRFERFIEGVQDAEKIRILREKYKSIGDKESSDLLELKIKAFEQGKITSNNAGRIVMEIERVLNELPPLPILPTNDYCEVGLIESHKNEAINKRWLTSVSTTEAKEELLYKSSSPSTDGYVKSSKIKVQQGKSFFLNLVATTNEDDIRFTRATIYADWNCDNIFNTFGNEVISKFGNADREDMKMLNITTKIYIPSDAVIGESRIRIRYADAWSPEPKPCDYNLKGFTFDIPMLITSPTEVEIKTTNSDADYIYHDGIFNFASPSEIMIFSTNGLIVCHKKDILSLQTNGYSHGSYTVKIIQGKKVSTTKIIL
ncbi:MAG: DUF4091 domain-containing protein [Bacteroidaceae bacterium]